jgi:hypothetical protein
MKLGARRMTDDEYFAAFEACTLDEFHHRDPIKIAYPYLRRHPLELAMTKVRTGLQALAVFFLSSCVAAIGNRDAQRGGALGPAIGRRAEGQRFRSHH